MGPPPGMLPPPGMPPPGYSAPPSGGLLLSLIGRASKNAKSSDVFFCNRGLSHRRHMRSSVLYRGIAVRHGMRPLKI